MKTCKSGLHKYTPVKGSEKGCLECRGASQKKWVSINPNKARDHQRKWRSANPDKLRELKRKRQKDSPDKVRAERRRWAENNPEKVRAHGRKRKYNITPEEWERLFESQGRSCANKYCKTTEPGSRGWQTDHCHKTNKVRGILCQPCNLALGHAKDCENRLTGLIMYLLLPL